MNCCCNPSPRSPLSPVLTRRTPSPVRALQYPWQRYFRKTGAQSSWADVASPPLQCAGVGSSQGPAPVSLKSVITFLLVSISSESSAEILGNFHCYVTNFCRGGYSVTRRASACLRWCRALGTAMCFTTSNQSMVGNGPIKLVCTSTHQMLFGRGFHCLF